jgi:CO/xanthine dehydrogenase FAD-binding subunit
MAYWNHYFLPATVEEALGYLKCAVGNARIVAGGTDLLLDIQQGRRPQVEALVDISEISDLRQIEKTSDHLRVGAAVTHAQIVDHPLLQKHAQCLVEACALIGGAQVRNVATIGGNVAHALPAGDGSIALLALDARAEVANSEGRRWMPMEELFLGPGVPSFDPTQEILLRFEFDLLREGERTSFRRVMRPQGVAIAILNMAIWSAQKPSGEIQDLRMAVGPAGKIPLRARRTEEFLIGRVLSEDVVSEAVEVLRGETHLRTSPHRATEAYRKHLLQVLVNRQLSPVFKG